MKPSAALANTAWLVAGVVKSRRFSHALSVPADAQHAWLMARVRRDAGSRYGEAHEFASQPGHSEFVEHLAPVTEHLRFTQTFGARVHGPWGPTSVAERSVRRSGLASLRTRSSAMMPSALPPEPGPYPRRMLQEHTFHRHSPSG